MAYRRTVSPVDAKLAELDRELRQVRRTLRSATRNAGSPAAPRRAPAARATTPAAPSSRADARGGELFAHAEQAREPSSAPAPRARAPGGGEAKERFAHYFASGSFVGATRPMREERRIRRNKALYMVILAVIVAFVIFSLLR